MVHNENECSPKSRRSNIVTGYKPKERTRLPNPPWPHDVCCPRDLPYSPSCCTNPKFGSAALRFDLIYRTACAGVHPYCAIKNAATTLTLLLIPSAQCTSTRVSGLLRRASRIHAVVMGRCAASSANGQSSTRMCRRRGCGCGWRADSGGMRTRPEMAETMCVIPCDERQPALSAKERSET